MYNEDTISGEVSVCTEQEAYRISMAMTDIDGQPVEVEWFAKVLDDNALLIWLYDKTKEPHVEIVHDIVELAVESKHLADLHVEADFSPRMWETYRMFLVEKYTAILKDGGLANINRKIMQEMSEGW
tara:strand:- start:425 stop:805 length:381 start_codon:yes stop_codon:yes gene_type:complete